MNEIIEDLKMCNKGIDVWQDTRLYEVGCKEQQLAYFYGMRDLCLSILRMHRGW